MPLISKFTQLPIILKATTLLILMYCSYGFIEMLFPRRIYLGDELRPPYIYIQNALNSFLPIFVFYRFFQKGQLTPLKLKHYIYVFLVLFTVLFFHNLSVMKDHALLSKSNREEFTNNASYSFVYLIPLLFFIRKTIARYIILAIIACFIVMGMKRGAMLTGFIGIICFLYFQIHSAHNHKSKNVAVFLSLIFVTGAICYVSYTMSSSEYFLQRLEQTKEGNSSNRDILYNDLLHEINTDTSLIHFIFGRGANSSILISGNYAHQDWLELMTNNGLLGVGLGIFFYYSIFRTAYEHRRKLGQTYYYIFLSVGILAIIPTFFSMIIYQLPKALTIMIGFLTGYAQQKPRPINARISNHNIGKRPHSSIHRMSRTL